MALTLHIAATEEEAARSTPTATVDEVLHRQLFERGLLEPGECPTLRRMSSPFDDVTYMGDELERLPLEIANVLSRANPVLAKQLEQIAVAAHDARRAGKCLFVVAD